MSATCVVSTDPMTGTAVGLPSSAKEPDVLAAAPSGSGPAWSPRVCPACVLVSVVAVLLLGLWAFGRGAARPQAVQARAQTLADERFGAAGFAWARLVIDGATGRVVGEAPDADSRRAAWAAAPRLLADLVGVPGVVSRLTDATSVSACGDQLREALALPAVRFAPGSYHLDPGAEPMLSELARLSERCTRWTLVVEATTDASAYEAGIRRLGQRRAQAVAAALMLQGVPVDRIESRAPSSADPDRKVRMHLELEPQRR